MSEKKENPNNTAETMTADGDLKALCEEILSTVRRCRNCNYCMSVCPLRISTRGFQTQSPSGMLQAIYYGIRWNAFGEDEGRALCEILYSCTTCNSCVIRCKDKSSGVPLLEVIEKGRDLMVEKMLGPLKDQRGVLASIQRYGNPYQRPASERRSWLGGETVKLIPRDEAEAILFVGCTASYEAELFPLGRALARLLNYLHIDFGILSEEFCCGDPVRRLGDRMLFEQLVEENLKRFSQSGARTVVSVSPHCMNVFSKAYNGLVESHALKHYTEYLDELMSAGKSTFTKALNYRVTYHDPCYLSKHNDITEPPRSLLKKIPGLTLVEMKDNRKNSLCCGGGGGRMYAEVEETQRLADIRIGQALEADADVMATSCPYCHVMLSNAIRDLRLEGKIQVLDVAELLAQSLELTP